MNEYDVAVIGAGIVGLATAKELSERNPGLRLIVLEKEGRVAAHQSGRNSGVIHSGLYYRPGSLRATLCREGIRRLVRFCDRRGVDYNRKGKVVVATAERERAELTKLEQRGKDNGLQGLRRIGPAELAEIEPHARGIEALHVPEAGAVDFGAVCRAIADVLRERGAEIRTSFRVENIGAERSGVTVESSSQTVTARGIVNCGGLFSDRLALMAGVDPEVRILPFRGEYFDVVGASSTLVRSSIYPVPDPRFPFLGVHLTRTVYGIVRAGPNAVPALAREGYRRTTVRLRDLFDAATYPGSVRFGAGNWRFGVAEILRSASRKRFIRSARALVPAIDADDLRPGRPGVRALAVTRTGKLHDDFLIRVGFRSVHVLNAPSPAATSGLAIGARIADQVSGALDIG